MKATINYYLSAAGQKAAIILGLPASREQTLTAEILPGDLDLFTIAADGSLLERTIEHREGYSWTIRPEFDSPLDAPQAIAGLRTLANLVAARSAKESAEKAEKEARQVEDRQAQLAQAAERIRAADLSTLRIDSDDGEIHLDDLPIRIYPRDLPADLQASILTERARRKMIEARIADLPNCGKLLRALDTPGKGDGWAKIVTDIDPHAKDGYGYTGDWGTAAEPGQLVVIVTKIWKGSRKRGSMVSEAEPYVRTGQYFCRARDAKGALIENGDNWATSLRKPLRELLALDPSERIRQTVAGRIARSREYAEKCVPSSTDDPSTAAAVAARRQGHLDMIAALQGELEALEGGDSAITDSDAAAQAIITAGYRALAKIHHPDAGGSDATMAIITEARLQLRELLKAAGVKS